MTVGELIEQLQQYDSEMPVKFLYPAGDYWRNTIAKTPCEVSENTVEYSSYHDSDVLSKKDNEDTKQESFVAVCIQ